MILKPRGYFWYKHLFPTSLFPVITLMREFRVIEEIGDRQYLSRINMTSGDYLSRHHVTAFSPY